MNIIAGAVGQVAANLISGLPPESNSSALSDYRPEKDGPPLKFDDLWNNYPKKVEHKDKDKDKDNKDIYDNHCAINVSDALNKSGVKLKKFKGAKCSGEDDGENKTFHTLRAEQLAKWLNENKVNGIGEPEIYNGENYLEKIKGRTGIVYFEDYWPREGESREKGPRTGDHIDLWKNNKLKSLGLPYSWLRRNIPSFFETFMNESDYAKSKKVIFWEIK